MQYIAHFYAKNEGKKLRVLPHDILLVGRVSQHQQKVAITDKKFFSLILTPKEIPGAQPLEHLKHSCIPLFNLNSTYLVTYQTAFYHN